MADKTVDVSWDYEAQQVALVQSQMIAQRDPEAASLLVGQLLYAQETQPEGVKMGLYDPLELYDVMCHENGWTPRDIDTMHYLTFFGIVKKRNERVRKENAQNRQ